VKAEMACRPTEIEADAADIAMAMQRWFGDRNCGERGVDDGAPLTWE
jgi:hypothetical protein